MIKAVDLTKAFGSVMAVNRVSLTVSRGESVGLVGPNGGGRTTLLRLLATLVRPSGGTLIIDGLDAVRRPYDVRTRIAFVGGEPLRGDGLRVQDFLAFMRDARQVPGARNALPDIVRRAGLVADEPVDHLSDGLKQRLALAAALQLKPAVLLLDDPFRGLDAAAHAAFREWIQELRDQETTIVAATNSDADTSALCDRWVRIDGGRLVDGNRPLLTHGSINAHEPQKNSVPTCVPS